MKKRFLLLIVVISFASVGCLTLEERLARRIGCDHKELTLHFKLNVPAYSQYEFVCEDQKWTCRDAPYFSHCNEGWHRDKKKGNEKAGGKKKKKKNK